jgi:Asp/Glu/hydantoin racemase
MNKPLVIVHTVRSVFAPMEALAREVLGSSVPVAHIVDDLLLQDLLRNRRITPFAQRHFAAHVAEAEEFGAGAVLLSCSSLAPCADVAGQTARVPVYRIDEAMVDEALATGRRIGILATIDLALDPVYELVCRQAQRQGRAVGIEPVLCPASAYEAMLAGRTAEHDGIVLEELQRLCAVSDVVLLAQASMASALRSEVELQVPVLTGPRLALERIRRAFGTTGAAT